MLDVVKMMQGDQPVPPVPVVTEPKTIRARPVSMARGNSETLEPTIPVPEDKTTKRVSYIVSIADSRPAEDSHSTSVHSDSDHPLLNPNPFSKPFNSRLHPRLPRKYPDENWSRKRKTKKTAARGVDSKPHSN